MRADLRASLGAWGDLPFFNQDWPRIAQALADDPRDILPPKPLRFAALEAVQPDAAEVVILGQDPYPTPGHAHGFAFSAAPESRPLPRSLSNIFKELRDDIGAAPETADLRFLATQGVLLLNNVLTVPAGQANGHAKLGWQNLTRDVLARLSDRPRAYVLWGAQAQKTGRAIDPVANLKIETPHPSPLSAHRGFLGSRPFSRVNDWLQRQGKPAIQWTKP